MQAICDFDGTISIGDVTDMVLERFAEPEWHEVESWWERGEIDAKDCMQMQVRMIRADWDRLNDFLDTIEIDPSFVAFKKRCDAAGITVRVLSDGVDHFIARILARHGISGLSIEANRLVRLSQGYDLAFPYRATHCLTRSGVCKCARIKDVGPHFYVGDGRSDFCVSQRAQHVFAKGHLIEHCLENGIKHTAFSDFSELLDVFEPALLKAS